jgi:hypothetical protein
MQRRIFKQLAVIVSYKTGATGTWCYDDVAAAKVFNEFGTNRFCLVPEAGIKSRLTATGLFFVIAHRAAGLFQYFDHIEGRLRVELVHKTWYEKLDVQAGYFVD